MHKVSKQRNMSDHQSFGYTYAGMFIAGYILSVSGLPLWERKIALVSVSNVIILPFHCGFISEYWVKIEILLLNNVRKEVEKFLLTVIYFCEI